MLAIVYMLSESNCKSKQKGIQTIHAIKIRKYIIFSSKQQRFIMFYPLK